MADITLRSVKGSALTHTEVDDNFSNLNTEVGEKLVSSNNLSDVGSSVTALNNLGATDESGAFTGTYDALHPVVTTINVTLNSTTIDLDSSFISLDLSNNTFLSPINVAEGKVSLIKINRAGYNVVFPSLFKWSGGASPDLQSFDCWVISLVCHDANNIFASATGHDL